MLDECRRRLESALAAGPATVVDVELALGLLSADPAAGSGGGGVLRSGWLDKLPQSRAGAAAGRGWQSRFFVLRRTSRVRCVLAYFKDEAAAAAELSAAGAKAKVCVCEREGLWGCACVVLLSLRQEGGGQWCVGVF